MGGKNVSCHRAPYLHTGRLNRAIANNRMRNNALFKQRSHSSIMLQPIPVHGTRVMTEPTVR